LKLGSSSGAGGRVGGGLGLQEERPLEPAAPPDRGRDGRDKAGPASGKNAGISHPEERAHHDVKSLRYLSFDTHSVILRKSTVSYFESPLLDMLIFIAHSLLSKTS